MSGKNELNWQVYEAITQYIYGALGDRCGVKVKGYGRNCKVKGKSTVEHQVDVLTEQLDGERQLLTAIECKYWNKKVDKDAVMKLAQIMADADITSGIIVCKSGFTPDTLTYAKHLGIKLVQLWEASENDGGFKKNIEIGTLNINAKVMVSRGKITSIDFGSCRITGEDEIMAVYYVKLHDAIGRTISFGEFLNAFSEEIKRRGELLKTTTIDYLLNRELFWRQSNSEFRAEKISITGFFTKIDMSTERSFLLTDEVWMIMNELFDKRRLTLSKSGLIWNLSTDA
ncbi:restriction endonuclease [Pedobacter deserti]|uniref:restriction endonuclease n=1 Tax=Pedobacter deserti TaxID=2817382 RepID=UPI002108BEB9|nr:restriction endonuclease [Pedobacter sp. SYSU D00382]